MNQQETNYPEQTFRIGRMSSAIWRTQSKKDGRDIEQFSVKIQKRYQDPTTGEWTGSEMYIFPSEIPALLKVAEKAYEYCLLKENNEES